MGNARIGVRIYSFVLNAPAHWLAAVSTPYSSAARLLQACRGRHRVRRAPAGTRAASPRVPKKRRAINVLCFERLLKLPLVLKRCAELVHAHELLRQFLLVLLQCIGGESERLAGRLRAVAFGVG